MSDQYKLALAKHLSVGPSVGTKITADYSKQIIGDFASAMESSFAGLEGAVKAIAESIVVEKFASNFRPGMQLDPVRVVAESIEKAQELALLLELVDVPVVAPVVEEVKAEATVTDEAKVDAPIVEDKPETSDKMPVDLTKVSVDDLPIHKTAKKAYKTAGLLTAADLELFAQARSLDVVNGIGAEWAEDTMKAIEALKA